MELPTKFKEKMNDLLGNTAESFFVALDNPSQKAITINTNRISNKDFENLADFEIEKIPLVNNGYYVSGLRVNSHKFSHLGLIYSQEPSAMYPVELLDIREGDIVLDLCSAPGGKAIQILEKLNGTGLLIANEVVFSRAKILYENLNRLGFKNFIITCNNPRDFENLTFKFDKIIVDAPCGGEGMFRKDNFDINNYNIDSIPTNAKRQSSILQSISPILKTGGVLVYSTCTYDKRENEEIVVKFLDTHSDFEIVPSPEYKCIAVEGLDTNSSYSTKYCLRRYPHLHKGEGQFMCKLKKCVNSNTQEDNTYNNIFNANNFSLVYRKERLTLDKEFKNIADISNIKVAKKGDNYFALPDITPNMSNLNVLSIGCVIGTMQKGSFKISHNFYHTYGELFYNKIDLDDEEIYKYLHGEEIDLKEACVQTIGICVVSHLGQFVGGGKVTNGKLKNYYPKELRI